MTDTKASPERPARRPRAKAARSPAAVRKPSQDRAPRGKFPRQMIDDIAEDWFFADGEPIGGADELIRELRLRARRRENTRMLLVLGTLGLLGLLYLSLTIGALLGRISVQDAKDFGLFLTPLVSVFGTLVSIYVPLRR
jgi:hypothetical protein